MAHHYRHDSRSSSSHLDNCGEPRDHTGDIPDFCSHKPQTRRRLCLAVRVSHDDLADRAAFDGDERHKFQTS